MFAFRQVFFVLSQTFFGPMICSKHFFKKAAFHDASSIQHKLHHYSTLTSAAMINPMTDVNTRPIIMENIPFTPFLG
jgi:hypothetical protein